MFDGTNPKKLCAFYIQCKLNFQDWPQAFRTDHAKVIFAQSYLKGMALEWFKLDLLGVEDPNDQPLWMNSWREFGLELQTAFGPNNPVADAKSQLDHLHMKDNQCINSVLHHHFYSGLPDHIKDEEIDAHYWECKEEIQWASKHQGSSTSSNNKSRGSTNNNQPKTSQEKAKTGNNNNSGSSPKMASSKPGNNNSNSSKPEPSKLRKDGKLTPEECKHCMEGNLCMFCGGPGHFADKCPKKAAKAKAHTVATTEAAPALGLGSTPETKK
ncbi:hypothetical protein M404DRAFT_33998 [Pisolithus tinctorius Marx 270]|uniref:CCHC-type domain-containing protein n=1 Tax=Pisolithus tinctorius Marx 270 TaxID=870435 RepID=A0A0C3NJT2_PISTI|nr:hypothetical protein M404DRAFT_33998 [Pisolithus tinctorius Marx 270]